MSVFSSSSSSFFPSAFLGCLPLYELIILTHLRQSLFPFSLSSVEEKHDENDRNPIIVSISLNLLLVQRRKKNKGEKK